MFRAVARFSETGASYAEDGRYRLWLEIFLRETLFPSAQRTMAVLGMNPSTAKVKDGYLVPDPTVTRLCGYARRECCDRLIIVNAFGIRLTDSKQLVQQVTPVGNPLNDQCIREAFQVATVCVAAWGRLPAKLEWRAQEVRKLLKDVGGLVYAFKVNQDGSPGHPLYLPSDASLQIFGGSQ